MMRQLKLSLLGTFQVTLDSQPITRFEYDKVRALLAYLAVESGVPHRRDSLAALFWPQQSDKLARKSLNQALYTLRKVLADQQSSEVPFIVVDHTSVRFNPAADVWLDVHEFARRVEGVVVSPGTAMAPAVLNRLRAAIRLYHGDFLQGFLLPDSAAFDDWAALQRERLHRQATDTLFALASYHERQDEVAKAIQYVRRLLALEPWREEVHRLLMRLLARSGQRSAALAQYDRCRHILAEELDVGPAQETVALYERIKAAASVRRHNLPLQPTPFISRPEELAHLAHLIANATVRLITLVGPGGMGKTRLALAAAAQEVDNFAIDGVFFVELSPVSSPDDPLAAGGQQIKNQIAGSIARAVGYQFQQNQREPDRQLLDYLQDKALFLILDNFEHLVDGADLVSRILQAAPGVKILITSRETLRLVEEQVFTVPGLTFSAERVSLEDAAVQLFLQRASRARPDFVLHQADMPHLTRICHQVGGMPLALELAASWVTTLSLADIAGEIQRDLAILATDLHNVLPRQRSVTAVLDASWQRLPEPERRLLRRLSLFRGSFDHLAAQSVSGASLPALSALVAKSLLRRYHPPATTEPDHARFTLHELVRRFAAQQLAEDVAEEAAARHAYMVYYIEFLAARQVHLGTPEQHHALAEVFPEYDNVRRAVLFACDARNVAALGKVQEIVFCFYKDVYRSFHEADEILGRIVEALEAVMTPDSKALEAILGHTLRFQAYICGHLEERARTKALNERALELALRCEERALEVAILNSIAGLALRERDYSGSELFFRQALQKAKDVGVINGQINTLRNLARCLIDAGRPEEARRLLEESRQLSRESCLPDSLSLILLGRLNTLAGALDEAGQQLAESLSILREIGGHPMTEVMAFINLGRLALQKGERDEAQRHLTHALSLAREIGLVREIAEAEQLLRQLSV
jgi:predicted ATPase/DNA-binding SARP family transcriptional activator